MAKTATRRSQMPNALKQTYAERMAKTKQLNIARDMAKTMKQEKIDDKRVSCFCCHCCCYYALDLSLAFVLYSS